MNDIKVCVLGGDKRQLSLAHTMFKYGYDVCVFGINGDLGNIKKSTCIYTALCMASIVILPLPFSVDGIRICCPLSDENIKLDDFVALLNPEQTVFGGKLTDSFISRLNEKNIQTFDYCEMEKFSILNAIPTAEGALSIAINETKSTIFGAKCAVLGYGRIAKILSKMLKDLGADVTVFARNDNSLSWAYTEGYNAVNIKKMEGHISNKEIIFNTIPQKILTKSILDKTMINTTIIDLASTPGGVDFEYAKNINRKVIFALGLPGKIAPESAGKIISDCIVSKYNNLNTKEVNT